mmetsp:Transcript_55788/g.130707  ORF Transcript_55788/g.130707 Transcript_55788/m.130707 type:complete len:327 (-) Transcript_55788:52-1032(-)|eukprot:3301788-Rhodomonas_salina.1
MSIVREGTGTGCGLRNRKGREVDDLRKAEEDVGYDDERTGLLRWASGLSSPSSDSTQLASDRMGEFDSSDDGEPRKSTLTLQVTGDPARILRKLELAGLKDVVVLESKEEAEEKSGEAEKQMDVHVGLQDEQGPSTTAVEQVQERSYFKTTMSELIWGRSTVLILLLVLQSASSVVLSRYQQLIERNVFLALFLTMVTGSGGNAGNQSSAMVIRGLSTGEINRSNMLSVLMREVMASSVIALVLALAAFGRVLVTDGCDATAAAIVSSSTYITVVGAIAGGTAVPLILDRLGLDPCNLSSPILATITDVMGVLLLCLVTTALVGSM